MTPQTAGRRRAWTRSSRQALIRWSPEATHTATSPREVTRCPHSTQHHAAPRSTTQHHAATRSNTQQHAAPHSSTQQHAAARSSTQQHAATGRAEEDSSGRGGMGTKGGSRVANHPPCHVVWAGGAANGRDRGIGVHANALLRAREVQSNLGCTGGVGIAGHRHSLLGLTRLHGSSSCSCSCLRLLLGTPAPITSKRGDDGGLQSASSRGN